MVIHYIKLQVSLLSSIFIRNGNIYSEKRGKNAQYRMYPWLDDSDERKYMSDKEILEKYIDLENSCLTK